MSKKKKRDLFKIVFNLQGCARCGEDHGDHEITEFINHTVIPVANEKEIVYNFWSHCPTTGEPNFFFLSAEVQEHGGDAGERADEV